MSDAAGPAHIGLAAWKVHLPTAVETAIRVDLGPQRPEDPWPISRALAELAAHGMARSEQRRALGSGRGMPILATQGLRWQGCDFELEMLHHVAARRGEAALIGPPWDDLVLTGGNEDDWWQLVDVFANAVQARHGAVVDGEPIDLDEAVDESEWRRRLRRHVALLVPSEAVPCLGAAADAYHVLPLSGLTVVLR